MVSAYREEHERARALAKTEEYAHLLRARSRIEPKYAEAKRFHGLRRALEDPGPPVYRRKVPRPQPVLGPYTALIDRWLREDLERPPKQRHTARRIYDRLVAEHGFRGGASTVRQYVREHRPRPAADVPLVLDYDPGADAQVDWGEAQVLMRGRLPPEADSSSACASASPSGTS